jgi:hypothetical protein
MTVHGFNGASHGFADAKARIIDMKKAMADTGPLPYRVRPFALDATVTLLVGRSGESKTWLGLLACAGVQRGAEGLLTCRTGKALYLDAENGPKELGRRFTKLGLDHDAFTAADGTGLRLPEDMGVVHSLVTLTGANLLILDSLRRLAPGVREDKSDDIAPLMAALAELARSTGCAIVVIHHRSTKAQAADVRGSSTLEDQSDVVFVLEKVRADPERRTRRRLRCVKMRPDREPPAMWLDFKTVAGYMTMAEAEPFEAEDGPPAYEVVAEEIRSLAPETPHGGWTPKGLAEAVGRRHDDKTFKAALAALISAHEWRGEGQTSARRIVPATWGTQGTPIGDDPKYPKLDEVDPDRLADGEERMQRLSDEELDSFLRAMEADGKGVAR